MTLAFDREGPAGRPVVMLHGIGGGRSIWRGTVAALAAAGFDAIAVDLPGYGDSARLTPGGVDAMAAAVVALLDHLALPRAAVVGHSMGGMVAQALAASAPQRLQSLVLACTSPAFGKPDGDWQARFVAERLAPLDAGLGMAELAARLVPPMVGPTADAAGVALAGSVMCAVPEATKNRRLASSALCVPLPLVSTVSLWIPLPAVPCTACLSAALLAAKLMRGCPTGSKPSILPITSASPIPLP